MATAVSLDVVAAMAVVAIGTASAIGQVVVAVASADVGTADTVDQTATGLRIAAHTAVDHGYTKDVVVASLATTP